MDCPQTRPPINRSTPRMLSEIRHGHNGALEIVHPSGQGWVRFSPAECARAKMEEAQSAPAGKNNSTTEFERRRAGLCAWPRPWSEPKPDRDRAVQGEIARCANHSECREHPRMA